MDYSKELRICEKLREYFRIRANIDMIENSIKRDKNRLQDLENDINGCIISVQDHTNNHDSDAAASPGP